MDEQHPAIWAMILRYMPMLFNRGRQRATNLYDAVHQICPEVLRHVVALLAIARVMGHVEPRERLQD